MFFRCFAGLRFSRRCLAVFLSDSFSSKLAPSRKSQTLRISLRESQAIFVFLQVFFRCFAGLRFSRRRLALFLRKTYFLVKMPPSGKSQTLRISFRESQTVFVFLPVFFLCFAGLWFSSRRAAVFLGNIHFLVKVSPPENHKAWGFPLENPKPSFIGESKDQPTRSHGSVENQKLILFLLARQAGH